MDLKIRPIQSTDYADMVLLFKELATFQKMPEKMSNSAELMNEESEWVNGFVIEKAPGELIGYATYFYAYFTWVGKSIYMDDLYVKPDYRGQGLGKKLIETVIHQAKTEHCKKVHWQVSRWNQKAIDFYQKLGAEVDDVESNCDYWLIKN